MTAADALGMFLILGSVPFCHFLGFLKGGQQGAWALSLASGSHAILRILSAGEIALRPAADNLVFHNKATRYAAGAYFEFNGPTADVWPYAISHIYAAFDSSIWLGYAITQWIFVLFLVQFLKFCEETGVRQYRWVAVVAFSLLPSVLLFGNFLLREPFQLLCLVIAIRHIEKFRRFGHSRFLIVTSAALVPFGAIHGGFFLFAPIALGAAVLGRLFMPPAGQRVRRVPGGALAGAIIGLSLLAVSVMAVGSFSENQRLSQVVEGDIDIAESLEGTEAGGGRTVFAWRPPVTGFSGLVFSPIQLFQFIFAPLFPLMIREGQDLVAAFDTGIRFLMLYGVYLRYRRSNADTKRMILFLIGLYLVFCLVASLGTYTVGTAMRHHLKVFWITIALGLPGLLSRQTRQRATASMRKVASRIPELPSR